jgi:hypothetical protein
VGIDSDYDLVEHIRAHRSVTDIPKVDSKNFLVVISTEPLETVGSVVSLLPALRAYTSGPREFSLVLSVAQSIKCFMCHRLSFRLFVLV